MTAPVRNASNGQFPGRVIAVHGSVIDVRFPAGDLPHVEEAIAIEADPARELIAEVQQHLGPMTVRAVALENTAGLRRGAKARATAWRNVGGEAHPSSSSQGLMRMGSRFPTMGKNASIGLASPSDEHALVMRIPCHSLSKRSGARGTTVEFGIPRRNPANADSASAEWRG